MNNIKPIRTLPCDLNTEEKLGLAEKLSVLNLKISELMVEKANLPKRIAAFQVETAELAKEYREGKVNREIKCYWKFDTPEVGKKTLYRSDTHEALNEVEFMNLFDIDDAESIFKLLRKNFGKAATETDREYIEFTEDECVAVLKTLVSEHEASAISAMLRDEFLIESTNKITIEYVAYPVAKKIIKDVHQNFLVDPEKSEEEEVPAEVSEKV